MVRLRPLIGGAMAVVLLVSNDRVDSLTGALAQEFRASFATSWHDLSGHLRSGKTEAVVFDMASCAGSHLKSASALIASFPDVPFLACTDVTKSDLLAVAALSREGLRGVVVYSSAGTGSALLRKINEVVQNPVSIAVLKAFAANFEKLPSNIRTAARDLFSRPKSYSTSRDFAKKASVSLSKLYRNLSAAGFKQPRRMIVSAKLFAFIGCFDSEDDSIKLLAAKLGYRSSRPFVRHSQKVFKTTPQAARLQLSKDRAIRLVLDWLNPEGNVQGYLSDIRSSLNEHSLGRRYLA